MRFSAFASSVTSSESTRVSYTPTSACGSFSRAKHREPAARDYGFLSSARVSLPRAPGLSLLLRAEHRVGHGRIKRGLFELHTDLADPCGLPKRLEGNHYAVHRAIVAVGLCRCAVILVVAGHDGLAFENQK